MMGVGLTVEQVEEGKEPESDWCKSGHRASKTWVHPITGESHPKRFFMVSGRTLAKEHWGVYCEECLAKAVDASKVIVAMTGGSRG